ncbi:hypothetical protein MRS44_017080 [Fusarium solani]|uniref:uncharacterized protein n=1 Tax=Fusarium solani TaxID=169388 RepID=UPI0032C3EFD5|nr:hypothetical protein MRS44_017080 [Fusarium solani]
MGDVKTAADEWEIPHSTIRDRLEGAESRTEAQPYPQCLSPVQSKHLTDWALTQQALGFPQSYEQLKEFDQRMVRNNGDNRPIGKHWIDGFLCRIYRKQVPRIVNIRENRPIVKAHLLICYAEASKEAMKPEAIQAGLKSRGMWPVSILKALLNPWFLERQGRRERRKFGAFGTPVAARKRPGTTEIAIMTVHRTLEVRTAIMSIPKSEPLGTTVGHLFRKVSRALDKHDTKLLARA